MSPLSRLIICVVMCNLIISKNTHHPSPLSPITTGSEFGEFFSQVFVCFCVLASGIASLFNRPQQDGLAARRSVVNIKQQTDILYNALLSIAGVEVL